MKRHTKHWRAHFYYDGFKVRVWVPGASEEKAKRVIDHNFEAGLEVEFIESRMMELVGVGREN